MPLTIGVDVGGTKIAAGVVDDDGHIVAQLRRETPSTDPVALVDAVAGLASELALAHDVRAIGIGAPGFIDETRSIVRFAPNLAWREEPLGDAVRKLTNLPVVVENDANSAAWAEARFGAGRDQSDVVMLTIGTGVGGGIVIGNRLFRGRFGIGAEMGHTNAVPDGRRCGCGNRGCYEQYASGRALVHEARELASTSPALGWSPPRARWWNSRGHRGRGGHAGRPGGQRRGSRVLRHRRALPRPAHGRSGRRPRPGVLRPGRRSVRGRRPAPAACPACLPGVA